VAAPALKASLKWLGRTPGGGGQCSATVNKINTSPDLYTFIYNIMQFAIYNRLVINKCPFNYII